jgi:hypothetical protein
LGTKLVGVRKNRKGQITELLTNDGSVLSMEEARAMAKAGNLDSLTDVHADGTWEINHTAGTDEHREGQNLDQLPEF